MKILHYTLGLPPYRTGGLTKYTYDLMEEQIRHNEGVYLLFPGQIKLKNKKISIKKYGKKDGLNIYEIINPLPVPLMNGISLVKEFIKKVDYLVYKEFLKCINVDVINVHTLMGLHKEFFIAAKELNIPIVYTTHDYFGLCPKVNFLDNNNNICINRSPYKCAKCNKSGDSLGKIYLLQSREYRLIKNIGLIEKVKKIKTILENSNILKKKCVNTKLDIDQYDINDYSKLLVYYEEIFNMVDKFIFNSTVARDIYSKYIDIKGDIISITHKDIKDNRKIKNYSNKGLRLTYLGPNKEYKGFNLLLNVMNKLDKSGYKDIKLNIYGDTGWNKNSFKNVALNGKYSYEELGKIFDSTDLLVVPSIWHETFGFITLEALSYGVPVLLTDKVGSKDLIKKDIGLIVSDDENEIYDAILNIYNDKTILNEFNNNIVNGEFLLSLSNHYEDIKKFYDKSLKEKS